MPISQFRYWLLFNAIVQHADKPEPVQINGSTDAARSGPIASMADIVEITQWLQRTIAEQQKVAMEKVAVSILNWKRFEPASSLVLPGSRTAQ